MSYILDALNKSEQERQQREQGISLQPLTGVPHPGKSGARWLPAASVAVVLAAAGVFAGVYFVMKAKAPDAVVRTAPVPSAQPEPQVPRAAVAMPPAVKIPPPAPVAQLPARTTVPAQTAVVATPASEQQPARNGASESVKSLYQRKGMSAEEAMAQSVAEQAQAKPAPFSGNVAGDTVKAGDAVKTFASDETASVQTREAVRQKAQAAEPAMPASTINQKALEAEMARQREAELAARVQAEIEKMQAQDARTQSQAKVAQAKPAPEPVAPDPDANVPLATQLSSDAQKRIPNIDFGAHVYAGRTNNGFVILNGKKRYTGDTVAPGLVVQRITEDGVILDMNGTRFKLNSMSSWIN
jgi:general secretion pathway protein B